MQSAAITNKRCPNDCSSVGVCTYVDLNSAALLKDCTIENNACIAKCQCDSNYSGNDCSASKEEMLKLTKKQTQILTQLLFINERPTLEPTPTPSVSPGQPTNKPTLEPIQNSTLTAKMKEKEDQQLLDSISLTTQILSVGLPMDQDSIELSANVITKLIETGVKREIPADKVAGFSTVISDIIGSSVAISNEKVVETTAVSDLYINYVNSFSQLAINGK